ncbi:hypothetical protein GQ457_11G015840 [Hibiscus cannabinus]
MLWFAREHNYCSGLPCSSIRKRFGTSYEADRPKNSTPNSVLIATVNGFGAVLELIYVIIFLIIAAPRIRDHQRGSHLTRRKEEERSWVQPCSRPSRMRPM